MISHHHQCVFVHIPKTAGQSIEIAFLADLGLTWGTRAPLLLRPNDNPELGPPRLAHLRAPQYVRYCYLSPELFARYFKFTVVRNPWDRVVSLYHYLHHGEDFPAFVSRLAEVLEQGSHWYLDPQIDFLTDDRGDWGIDFIARFERLARDFAHIREGTGLGQNLPHVNQSVPPTSQMPTHGELSACYSGYYDADTRDRVARIYGRDVDVFGYRFD